MSTAQSPDSLQVLDKTFVRLISEQQIAEQIQKIAEVINREYEGKNPLFVVILNGAFMFASDIFKLLKVPARISFVKIASYSGLVSAAEKPITAIGLDQNLHNQDIIILDDILDTGKTLYRFVSDVIKPMQPKSVKIGVLLYKPKAHSFAIQADYVGFEIDERFVVGYGLDYDGHARNLAEIYQLKAGE